MVGKEVEILEHGEWRDCELHIGRTSHSIAACGHWVYVFGGFMDWVRIADQIEWIDINSMETKSIKMNFKFGLNLGVLSLGNWEFMLFGGESIKGEWDREVFIWNKDGFKPGPRIKYGEKGDT